MRSNLIIVPILHLLYLANGMFLFSCLIFGQWVYCLGSLGLYILFLIGDERFLKQESDVE